MHQEDKLIVGHRRHYRSIQVSDADDLCEQLSEILLWISVDDLDQVFAACIDRVHQITEGNWDYIT
jgi:hypothetical protein